MPPPPPPRWLLFAAGALSYGVSRLLGELRRRPDRDSGQEKKQKRSKRRRRRRKAAARAAEAAVAVAATAAAHAAAAAASLPSAEEERPAAAAASQSNTYCPLRERVSTCQARWVLEEMAAAAAAADGASTAERPSSGRHAARAAEMLAAGFGSGLGGEDAARWARVAWSLKTYREPAAADLAALGAGSLVVVGAGGGGGRRRRRGRGGEDGESASSCDEVRALLG
jgi:hypothetical protein